MGRAAPSGLLLASPSRRFPSLAVFHRYCTCTMAIGGVMAQHLRQHHLLLAVHHPRRQVAALTWPLLPATSSKGSDTCAPTAGAAQAQPRLHARLDPDRADLNTTSTGSRAARGAARVQDHHAHLRINDHVRATPAPFCGIAATANGTYPRQAILHSSSLSAARPASHTEASPAGPLCPPAQV